MLGLPAAPGIVGTALLVAGLVPGLVAGWLLWRRCELGIRTVRSVERAVVWLLAVVLAVTVAAAPFIAWRIVQDIRFTSRLTDEEAEGAGPIQSFLQAGIFDEAREIIPSRETYYAVALESIREEARIAFRPWALTALFPRVAASRPAAADWIVAWGLDPRTLNIPVVEVRIVRKAVGMDPALYVARVAP